MTDSTTSFLVLLIGLFVSFRCRTASCFQHQHHGICGVGRISHHHNVRSKTNNRVVTILRLRVAAKEEEEEDDLETSGYSTTVSDRRSFFHQMASSTGSAFAVGTGMSSFPARSYAKSYSENASNLERINAGDYSGGASFNNNPTTESAKKRRAMTGCKTPIAREEAAQAIILKQPTTLGEKECNTMVMDGNTEFMLRALRNLDCPTCPYGIAASTTRRPTN